MEPAVPTEPPRAPRLRQDLGVILAPPTPDGQARFLLHDPVAGRFHRIGKRAMELLSGRGSPTEAESKELAAFTARHHLAAAPLPPEALARAEIAARPGLGQLLVHRYLFFRIPLVRPQRALDALAPFAGFAFHRRWWWLTGIAGLLGLVLAGRQWETFRETFLGFLTLEGMVGYALAIICVKALHEMGHGLAAQRFGVRVPVMGVAFLVLFPVLYTDTTQAWKLRGRRERVIIDAAGMATELMVAAWALLAWSFLPEGPARQVAFFLATTSWTMSLLVNLNPCMRFDGYYLIGDSLGVANLQETGFRFGRWRMREALFGWGDPRPPLGDAEGAGMERALLAYAYGTWVYRFFLFVGIALLVHHLFPKAIGIILFCVEIGMFIALPLWREIKVWSGRRADTLRSRRGRRTLALAVLGGIALFAPLSTRVSAPAYVRPAETFAVHAPIPAEVLRVHVAHGEHVAAGEALVELRSESLAQALREAELELAAARAERDRSEAVRAHREERQTAGEAVARAEARLEGLRAREAALILRAPAEGVVELPGRALHAGRYSGVAIPLLHLRAAETRVEARIAETQAARISDGARARVMVDGRAWPASVETLAPVSEAELSQPAFASLHGGPIMVDVDAQERLVARVPQVAATLRADGLEVGAERRARAFVSADRESLAQRVWRRVVGILLRENDF